MPGRKITDNIHVVQDFINLINKNEESAAFIFYDQEKAFDRMSHRFIIKPLQNMALEIASSAGLIYYFMILKALLK